MNLFTPKTIVDPRTGEKRIISPEEQAEMLAKGIVFSVPFADAKNESQNEEENND